MAQATLNVNIVAQMVGKGMPKMNKQVKGIHDSFTGVNKGMIKTDRVIRQGARGAQNLNSAVETVKENIIGTHTNMAGIGDQTTRATSRMVGVNKEMQETLGLGKEWVGRTMTVDDVTAKLGDRFKNVKNSQQIINDSLKKYNTRLQTTTSLTGRFRFEFLGIMFAGMALAKSQRKWLQDAKKSYIEVRGEASELASQIKRIEETQKRMKAEAYEATKWVHNLNEQITEWLSKHPQLLKFVGTVRLFAAGMGTVLQTVGQAMLAYFSLVIAMKSYLATKTDVMAAESLHTMMLHGIIAKTKALKVAILGAVKAFWAKITSVNVSTISLKAFNKSTKGSIISGGILTTVIGAVSTAFKKLAVSIGSSVVSLKAYITQSSIATSVSGGLTAAVTALSAAVKGLWASLLGPIALIIALIGVLMTTRKWIEDVLDGTKKFSMFWFSVAQTIRLALWPLEFAVFLIEKLGQMLGLISKEREIRIPIAVEGATEAADYIADYLKPGSPPKKGPLSDMDMWGKNYAYMISEGLNRGENFIRGAAGNIGKTIMDTIIPLLDFFGLLRSLVMGKEKLDLEAEEPEEGGFLSWLWEAATSGFEAMKLNISAVLDTIAGFAFALWRGLVDDVIPMAIELAKKAWNWLWDIMKWAYDGAWRAFGILINLAEKAWGWLWDIMKWAYDGIWRTFGMLINLAEGAWGWLWDIVKWMYNGIWRSFGMIINFGEGSWSWLWDIVKWMYNGVWRFFGMFINLDNGVWSWLWDLLSWMYRGIWRFLGMFINLDEGPWSWLWDVMLWMYRGVWRTFGMLINIAKGIGNWLWNVLEWAYGGITKVIDITVNLLKGAGGALWNAITTTTAALIPGIEGRKQMGGPINQTGLYMLHMGEYVVPKKNVSAGAGGNNINVYVNLSSNISSQMDIKRVSEELGREIARDIEKRLGVF